MFTFWQTIALLLIAMGGAIFLVAFAISVFEITGNKLIKKMGSEAQHVVHLYLQERREMLERMASDTGRIVN